MLEVLGTFSLCTSTVVSDLYVLCGFSEHEEMARQISIFLDLEKNINGADAKGDKQD